MRFFNGVIVGVLLAIAAAYWHDRSVVAGPDGAARELVNWEEFGRTASDLGRWVQGQISQLGESLHRPS